MVRLLATLRWRHVRWAACAAVIPALWACNDRKLAAPVGGPSQVVQQRFQQSINRDLDILFMVDNSQSMMPLQTKMTTQLPTFMNVLKNLSGGQPNLHVAVVSSSLGAGRFGDVPGCAQSTVGNTGGAFQHQSSCAGLHTGEHFLRSIADPTRGPGMFTNNFDGDIATVFSCIALLGDTGCGFEHQFASTIAALQKASNPMDPDNAGFLRPKAFLAVVMLTNEDDCSTPLDFSSDLFNPRVETLSDPTGLGGLQSYRCNEFGHLCDPGATPPPHSVTGQVTLNNCVSSEGKSPGPGGSAPDPTHQLIKVDDFVSFLKGLKDNPDRVLVAALAGPTTKPDPMNRNGPPVSAYVVEPHPFQLGSGGMETQPWMVHSCTSGAAGTEYADPGVRIKSWLDKFGGNGVFEQICAPDFAPAMTAIATAIGKKLSAQCVTGTVLHKTDVPTDLDCDVSLRTFDTTFKATDQQVPYCSPANLAAATLNPVVAPCWRLGTNVACMQVGKVPNQLMELCYDPTCSAANRPPNDANASVSCALCPSGTVPQGNTDPGHRPNLPLIRTARFKVSPDVSS